MLAPYPGFGMPLPGFGTGIGPPVGAAAGAPAAPSVGALFELMIVQLAERSQVRRRIRAALTTAHNVVDERCALATAGDRTAPGVAPQNVLAQGLPTAGAVVGMARHGAATPVQNRPGMIQRFRAQGGGSTPPVVDSILVPTIGS